MISRSDQPKYGRTLEIAIVISIAVHLLLGGFATFHPTTIAKMLQHKEPKEDKMVALSTAIRIEKRTKPRYVPPARPQQQHIPQPQVAPRPAQQPIPRAMVMPQPKPTELAKIVPHAKPEVVARMTVPHANPNPQLSQQQLSEMEQHFADTIAAARAASDPTRVQAQQGAATMKRAHLDIAGVNELLRHGEGILTPRDWFTTSVDGDPKGMCYYVDYQINFNDGAFDSGPVYWPICYTRRTDPFWNHWQHFPLPPPQPGWQPSAAQWAVIAQHPLLRLYFPGRFPDSDNMHN